MAVDLMPLGEPELGMTRAELIAAANESMSHSIELYSIFFTLVFAYIVAMYLAGSQLTRTQYSIANTLFLLTMVTVVLGVYETWETFNNWYDSAFDAPRPLWADVRNWLATVTMVVSVCLAMWFGRKVRHPSVE
jgi:hypothetical protein